MILLDTNVWSVQTKPRAERTVLDWLDTHADAFLLSTIVIAEIRSGIENPAAAHHRPMLTQWLQDIETRYQDCIVPLDGASAHEFGRLIARRKLLSHPTKLLDAALAAQALALGCPVATRNTGDFEWTGARLIDPWRT